MSQSVGLKVFSLSFGKVLTSVIGLVSVMILSRILSLGEYATYRQTLLVYSFSVPLLTLGLPDAIYYFLGDELHRKRGIVNDTLFLLLCIGGLFGFFLLVGGNSIIADRFNNPKLAETLQIFSVYPIFTLPLATVTAVLVVQSRLKQLLVFNIFSRLLLFLLVIIAAIRFSTAKSLIYAEVISGGIVFGVLLWLLNHSVPSDQPSIKLNGMKRILLYSIPLGLASMIGTISAQMHQVLVSTLCSPSEYAIYTNGTFEIPFIGVITGSIATIILVELRRFTASGQIYEALALFRKAAIPSSMILFPVMIYLFIFADQFISVLFSEKYLASVIVFRISLLILPARIIYYGSALLAFGLSKIILFRSALSLLFNALLSIGLINIVGYYGAIISFIVVLYLWDVLYNWVILAKKFQCRWHQLLPFSILLKVFTCSLLTSIIILPFFLFSFGNLFLLIITSVIYFSATWFLFYKVKLLSDNWIVSLIPFSWKKFIA